MITQPAPRPRAATIPARSLWASLLLSLLSQLLVTAIADGERFRAPPRVDASAVSVGSTRLTLTLFYDDVETVNPLGAFSTAASVLQHSTGTAVLTGGARTALARGRQEATLVPMRTRFSRG